MRLENSIDLSIIIEYIFLIMREKITPTQKALNIWAIILIIWAIYRAKFRMPDWFDEFIAKPLVFIFPVYYYINRVEKKDFLDDVYLKTKKFVFDILLGLLIGGGFFLISILANYLKFHKLFLFNQQNQLGFQGLLMVMLMAIATGISEEILSRGFVLKRLYEESKNVFTSSFFASILFFFLHVPILFTNMKISGNILLMFMATDMILSLVNSFIFLERKSLILPILIHAFYNLSIILFI